MQYCYSFQDHNLVVAPLVTVFTVVSVKQKGDGDNDDDDDDEMTKYNMQLCPMDGTFWLNTKF